jgi:methylenetetrahydrofolate dehydrogenase (NADP+) / methenyltetrahydrofolate cyclohydrolase
MTRTAKIIDGKKLASEMRAEMAVEIKALKAKGVTPGLAVVLVGDNPASQVYVRMKEKACEELGIASFQHKLPKSTSGKKLLHLIQELNADKLVHGILVQLPLPRHIDEKEILNAIDPAKDVDGFHPVNVGKMLVGEPGFRPCTPYGCQQLLVRYGYDPEGQHVVVVGRSNIVGKPVAAMLMQKAKGANATVTVCHSRTRDISKITRQADILIAAMGVPEFVKGNMVKPGAVVIDVGVNRVDDPSSEKGYKLVGDVDFKAVSKKAKAITPVPGGVGPMTITMLMKNTLQAAQQTAVRKKKKRKSTAASA